MGLFSKSKQKIKHILDGISPDLVLKERGYMNDKGSYLPEVPDYLGYIFGVILIWLVWVGYRSASVIVQEQTPKISKSIEQIKKEQIQSISQLQAEKMPEIIPPIINVPPPAISISDSNIKEEEKNENINPASLTKTKQTKRKTRTWKSRLEELNEVIGEGADYLADSVHGLFNESHEEPNSEETYHPKQVTPNKAPKQDALEQF